MSWNVVYTDDIFLTLSGEVKVKFKCPRCDKVQEHKIDALDLVYGAEIECSNIDVCDKRQFYGELVVELSFASYKGLLDRPLNKIE